VFDVLTCEDAAAGGPAAASQRIALERVGDMR
jgi:hypothetical protein